MNPSRVLADEYSAKAPAYDEWWAPVLRPLACGLLDQLPSAGAGTIVDIGAGTGGLLPVLRARAPAARIIGVDAATGMLAIARRDHPAVAAMDAARLALRSEAADVAVMAFMLFHLPEPAAGLVEARRVLRPGGVLGVATWGDDPGLPGLGIWAEELDAAGAGPDPRDPAVMRQAMMDTPEKLAGLLSGAGFDEVRVTSDACRHAWTVEALMAVQAGCCSPIRRLATLPAAARHACADRVRRRLEGCRPPELVYEAEVLLATGIAGTV